jgi:hypothetical protein
MQFIGSKIYSLWENAFSPPQISWSINSTQGLLIFPIFQLFRKIYV